MTDLPSGGMRMGRREVTRLLAAVLGEDAAPMDLVVARLHEADSARWVMDALVPRSELMSRSGARREDFVRWKDDAKASFAHACGDPVLVTATFLDYATSIAAALDRGHGLITSIPASEIVGMLDRIGPLLPAEWRDMFARARQRV
ncbi:MAG: hypothetical protein FGM37_04195 [Phycisphaerales bacterium]|nr:hypothetical protein [Phycisphaerales bacterium]